MNLLIISLFDMNPSGRTMKIALKTFSGFFVYGITSNFDHGKKEYYKLENEGIDFVVDQIPVPSYKRNISVKRIFSHLVFAFRLKKKLNSLPIKPDIVYCAMPSSSAAYMTGKWCRKKSIPFMIDIIDIWPDSLLPVVPFQRFVNLIVSPWKYITYKAYKMANFISGESKRYVEIGHQINPKVPYLYTYLGVDLKQVQKLIYSSKVQLYKPENEIWIAYGGSLGQSYDFYTILKGIRELENKHIPYKMWFVGGGEKEKEISEFSQRYNLNVEVTGRIPYEDYLKYLSYCDIGINTFKEGTRVVHSYKFNDYVASGCLILNNLTGETADMVNKYKIGYNFTNNTFVEVLMTAIYELPKIKTILNHNLNQLIQKELNTETIYPLLRKTIQEELMIK